MKGTIDGSEVYLPEGQLPAFTSSVNSIIDPSKIKGVFTATVKLTNTKESRRIFGAETMDAAPLMDRPVLRINDGGVDVMDLRLTLRGIDRYELSCISVGGNATWFEQAKDTRIHDLDMGISEELDSALQIATWDDDDSALYFPLVDFGSLEGRADTYDVPVTALRAGLRVHKIIEAAMYQFGYRVVPIGKINRIWKKLVIYDPKAKPSISIPGPYPAYEDYYTSNPAPDGYYFIPNATGAMQVTCTQLELNFNPADSRFDAAQFTLVVYDYSARKVVASYELPLYYSGDADYGSALIDHVFTGVPVIAGHSYYVSIQCSDIDAPFPVSVFADTSDIEYDRDSGAQVLRVRPGNDPNLYALMPTGDIGAYYEGYRINIAKAGPDWTVDKLLKAINSVFCLTFSTDSTAKILKVELDAEYFRKPATGRPFRDWTERMDHTVAPAIINPELPSRLILKYENDDGDKYLTMAERRARAEHGFASFVQDNPKAYGNEVTVTVPLSATINGKLFGGLSVPVMRELDGTYQEDNLDRNVRLLVADGLADGTWRFDSVDQTTYPVCYFTDPSTPLPLPFGNANFNRVMDPISSDQNWSRRLLDQRSSRILEAHLFIRDHELQDFDHGLPTLVDDGSGKAWYWVQEIKQHRFGVHQATKCILVQIPDKEVAIVQPEQPAISYPDQPFACSGPGYISFVIGPGTGLINMDTNSGYFSVRASNGTITTYPSLTDVELSAGTYCVWTSDEQGALAGEFTNIQGIDAIAEVDLSGIEGMSGITQIFFDGTLLEEIIVPLIGGDVSINFDNSPITNVVFASGQGFGYISCGGDALTEAAVDHLITRAYQAAVSGSALTAVNLDGGTSSPPSGAVAAYIAALTGGPNMSITGTGLASTDGDYDPQADINGRSAYIHAVNGITEVFWTGAQWRSLAVDGIFDSYDNVLEPWLVTTWILVSGSGSLPTVIAPGYGVTVTTN